MIKIRNFCIEGLDMDNIEHYNLMHKLDRDKKSQEYICRHILEWVKEPDKNNDEFQTGKTYVIKKDKSYIGIFGTMTLTRDGYLELWYDLSPEKRGRGYADHFVGEITPYLIEKVQGLNDIKLKICKSNKASNKIAINNGYILVDCDFDTNSYEYFNEKNNNNSNIK